MLYHGNTAVLEAAAKSLLQRNDLYGAELVFGAIAVSTHETNDNLFWHVVAARQQGQFDLDRLAAEILSGANSWARAGVRRFLGWWTGRP
jgi:hypothetical protein